jgi:low temperature requirement protein LtrA
MDEVAGTEPATQDASERRASYLELFFDLVFVYAVTQIADLIIGDTSPGGFARAALMLGMVWWAWSAFAWMTNAIDLSTMIGRVALLVASASSFFVALAVPEAFGDAGEWFAIPYLAVRVLHLVVYVYGIRADPVYQRAVLRSAPLWLLSPVIIVIGGFFDDPTRAWIWLFAVALDIAGALIAGRQEYHVSASHFAERYQLFVIIALGESIVAIGVGIEGLERDVSYALAAAVTFAGAALLWWAYFDFAGLGGERALHRTAETMRGKMARDVYTFCHFPMIAGIILFAVSAKKTVAHPGDVLSTAGRVSLAAGIALYMLGFVGARWRTIGALAWERIAAAVTVPLLVLALRGADALLVMAGALVLLGVWIAVEAWRLRDMRRQLHLG